MGAARLAAEQTAASRSVTAALVASHVRNHGVVLSIAPGQGIARGQWIIVTQEQTTGSGPYAGLTARRPGSWEADLVQRLVKGTVGWDDELLRLT